MPEQKERVVFLLMDRHFRLSENRTDVPTEVLAGLTTFVTMAYIIFVNPLILGSAPDRAGTMLPKDALLTATCLTAAVMSILMGSFTHYPLALAAGMGLNAVVAHELVGLHHLTWAGAMGIIVMEGAVITLLVLVGVREAIMNSIPMSLKRAIGAGIGLFIAFLGFQQAGLVQITPDGLFMGRWDHWPVAVALVGLVLTGWLVARGLHAGLLLGILGTTLLAIGANALTGGKAGFAPGAAVLPSSLFALPQFGTLGRFDFSAFTVMGVLPAALVVFSVMLSDFFDTVGTVVAVGEQAGFLEPDGTLPRARQVLLIDSLAALAGGLTGSSSATTYIESASGVAAGGRTGLTAVIVGLCFLLAIFLNPLAGVIPAQAVAPALIIVGFLMMSVAREIPFDKVEEGLPAFLTMVLMPFTTSITNGIAAGFLMYSLIQLLLGRFRQVPPAMLVADVGFLIYFLRPLLEKWTG
jgi:AGZA family xanthine/uracil permease-like MFS transporter